MNDVPDDELARWDETLLDGDEPPIDDDLPFDDELRTELMRQRLVHGLLRESFQPDRTGARERRIKAILAAMPAVRASGRILHMRPWLSLAAALLVAAVIAFIVTLQNESPRLHAMVNDAIERLQSDVDRRYRLRIWDRQPGGEFELCGTHTITARPGKLRLELDGVRTGKWDAGVDGDQVWRCPRDHPERVEIRPVSQLKDLLSDFLRGGGLVELGYLDLAKILAAMPADADLVADGTSRPTPGGPELEQMQCDDPIDYQGGVLTSLSLWVDPQTSEVYRLAFLLDGPSIARDRQFRLVFKYEGLVSAALGGDKLYAPPR